MTLVRKQRILYSVRQDVVDTKGVELTHPTATATTQEDANRIFDERLTALEECIDGGTY